MYTNFCCKKSARLSAVLIVFIASTLTAAPNVEEIKPSMRLQGVSTLTFFGFRVYDARLWVSGDEWLEDGSYALELSYHREIPAQKLIEATAKEIIRQQKISKDQLTIWLAQLKQVFPDVAPGDRITALHMSGGDVHFYHNYQLSGSVSSPGFSAAFFDIWLGEDARYQSMRDELLGQV